MGSRFVKFSERGRRVLSLAQEEAQRFNHNYMGPEHILLGLVRETEGMAARVLSGLGVDLGRVRSQVEFIVGRGPTPPQGEIGMTPRAKKVVELAVDESSLVDQTYIGTEHLLIGLLREGEGIAAGVLESLNVHLEEVRAEVHRIQSTLPPESPAETQQRPRTTDRPRVMRVDTMLEEIIERLAIMDKRLTALENTLNSRFDSLESRMTRLEERLPDR